MDYVYLSARAKINIVLDVIAKRPDGYHELEMIMQTVGLSDSIYIKKLPFGSIKIISNMNWLPVDEKNLVYRAIDLLKKQFDLKDGIFVELTKSIPVAAGLAGGSADCAAALVGMRKLYRLPLSNSQLMDIGKELGADVPYCIMRGTVLAKGIGEKLTRLPPFPKTFVLLAKPPISVSTASIFSALDFDKIQERPDVEKMIYAIRRKDLKLICDGLCNVLETVTIPRHPVIGEIKELMLKNNSIGCLMSGSGPTVFGFFESKNDAVAASKSIAAALNIKNCYLTTIYN